MTDYSIFDGNGSSSPSQWALQPKKETGVESFSSKYPNYDGRNTIIAIFDSGVDPGANGLQITSEGKRKIIERIDASGAGDVIMSKEIDISKEKTLKGLSNRLLTLPPLFHNPSGKVRLGLKKLFDLYPKSLKERIIEERLKKLWEPSQREAISQAVKALPSSNTTVNSSESLLEKMERENKIATLEALESLDSKWRESSCGERGDYGPLLDVLLYHDGNEWIVLLDNTYEGRLEFALRLKAFGSSGDFGALSPEDSLNVSVNVFEDGDVVQIVSMYCGHGTHVASMAAGYFPEDNSKNGVAPGAQIISLTIGDGRLNSMETGTALVRAMLFILNSTTYKVDIINMSYGEFSHWTPRGRIASLINDVIHNHGVLWAVSAGNNGPALSTISSPPDMGTNALIGVGAFVSPKMMEDLYASSNKTIPGSLYTWSSRGPTISGERGVSIMAPGGAITSVPNFTLQGSLLMNGTSMACPHVSGALSLLLSGLKDKGIPYSPFSIKRALCNTARFLSNVCPLGQGHGLLQVEKAFDHAVLYSGTPEQNVHFALSVNLNSQGILIRDELKISEMPSEHSVTIEPRFLNHESVTPRQKIDFHLKLLLISEEPWITSPTHLELNYSSRSIGIVIDPRGLAPGSHFTSIKVYNALRVQQGFLFEIPVTVLKSTPLSSFVLSDSSSLLSTPSSSPLSVQPFFEVKDALFKAPLNTIARHFLRVPSHASWAVFTLRSSSSHRQKSRFMMHAVQLLPHSNVKTLETSMFYNVTHSFETTCGFPVKGSGLLELCLAQWWSDGHISTNLHYSLVFHGLNVEEGPEIVIHGSESIARLTLTSAFKDEEITPDISLKDIVSILRPNESQIFSLKERDTHTRNKVISFELHLTYGFSVGKSTEVTPNLSFLSSVLYESEFESQLWNLYNSQRRLLSSGDAYPSKWSVKLPKGDYVLKASIRHEKKEILDKLTELPCLLKQRLPGGPINLDLYSSYGSASIGGSKITTASLRQGVALPLYVTGSGINDKYAKGSGGVGSYLCGTLKLSKEEFGKKGGPSYPLKYILFEPSVKKDKKVKKGSGAGSVSDESLQEALLDFKISWLSKLGDKGLDGKAEALYTEILSEYEKNEKKDSKVLLLAHVSYLSYLAKHEKESQKLIEISNIVLKESLGFEALWNSSASLMDQLPNGTDLKREAEKTKGYYLEALVAKGLYLISSSSSSSTESNIEEINSTLCSVLRVTEATDSRVIAFSIAQAKKLGHYGRALKYLLSTVEEKGNHPETEKEIIEVCNSLGWTVISSLLSQTFLSRFPEHYEHF